MDEPIVVGIDVGTTKICTLVGREEGPGQIRILGVGIEPSQGMRKGVIVDLAAASQAVARSIEKAERTSGLEITSALVSLAGSNVSSVNSRGRGRGCRAGHRPGRHCPRHGRRPGGRHPAQPRDHPRHPARL